MKTLQHSALIITLAMLLVVGCGNQNETANSETAADAPSVAVVDQGQSQGAQESLSAMELLQQQMPSEDEIIAEVLRYKDNADSATLQKVSMAPGAVQFNFMTILEQMVVYDGETGQPLAEGEQAEEGDIGYIYYRIYYEEFGDHATRIEGFIRFVHVFDGAEFVNSDVEIELAQVTTVIEGDVYNFIRYSFDPDDPYALLPWATVKLTAEDDVQGTITRVAQTDESGHYQVTVFSGFQYMAQGFAAGFESTSFGPVTAPVGQTVYLPFNLWPAENGGIEIGYIPISGTVVDLNSDPVEGVLVEAIDPASGELILSTTADTTGSDGSWEIMLPGDVSGLEIVALYGSVSTSVVVENFPSTSQVEIDMPVGPPVCQSFEAPRYASPGEEITVSIEAENPMSGVLHYSYGSPQGGSFPLGADGYVNWTIWVLPQDQLDYYYIGARVTNAYGSCQLGAVVYASTTP
jgi:hypothetical protein